MRVQEKIVCSVFSLQAIHTFLLWLCRVRVLLTTSLSVHKGWDAALVKYLVPIEFSISDIPNVLLPLDFSERSSILLLH